MIIPEAVIFSMVISSFLLSLLAMGFTMQYITLSVPNLAYADLAFFCAYISATASVLGYTPYVAVPFAFALGSCVSYLLYKFLAFLRDRGMPVYGLMLATLVPDLIIYAVLNIYAEIIPRYIGAYIGVFNLMAKDFNIGGVPGILIVSAVATLGLVSVFHLILTRTKTGIAMRAVMESYSLATVHGINTELVLSLAWFLLGGIAGIAGSLYPMWFSTDPWVGANQFINIFAACIVGGLRSIYGSLLGGILVGVSQVLVSFILATYFGPSWWAYSTIWAMLIAALVLLKMPEGLAGFFASRK